MKIARRTITIAAVFILAVFAAIASSTYIRETASPTTNILPNPTDTCGDGLCQKDEVASCSKDCGETPTQVCGNGTCEGSETCSTCGDDCGACPATGAESHFGVHLGSLGYDTAVGYLRELGQQVFVRTGWARDGFGWRLVKGERNVAQCRTCCDPARSSCACDVNNFFWCTGSRESLLTDVSINGFAGNGFNQLVTVMTDHYDDTAPTTVIAAYPAGHEGDYREYVAFLVEHYGDRIKYWVVGNENEGPAFWADTPEAYARMVVLASEEIRGTCADCRVGISFAHPNLSAKGPELNERWYSAIGSVCDSIHFIDAHFFTVNLITPGTLDRWKETCPGKQFLSTETGVADNTYGGKPQNAGGSLDEQAIDLPKYTTMMFAEGYAKIFWYLIDTDYGSGDIFLHNALIDESGAKKPAFTAYQTMIDQVDYFTSIDRLADGQYRYSFADRNPAYVLWCESGGCALPPDISGRVRVTDYLGHTVEMDAAQLSLTTNPVYVEQD